MFIKRHIFIFLVLLFIYFPLIEVFAASGSNTLTEITGITDEDHRQALSENKISLFNSYTRAVMDTERLQIGREAFLQASARKDQAFSAFLPQISLQGAYILPESVKSTSVPMSTGLSTGISLYYRQNIITGLDFLGNYRTAGITEKQSTIYMQHDAGLLLLDVANIYYNVLIAEHDLQNSNEMLKLYDKMKEELNRRVALGRSRSSDLLRLDTQIYQLNAQIRSLENQYDSLKSTLSTLTGISGDYTLDDSCVLEDITGIDSKIDQLLSKRFDIKAAEENLELSRINLQTAYGGHLPTIFVQGAYTLERRTPGTDYYTGIGAEVPIFSGGEVSARIDEAKSANREAILRLDNAKRLARQDISDAAMNYKNSGEEVIAFTRALDSAQKNYTAVYQDYQHDRVTILDLLTSMTTLLSAKKDSQNAILIHRLNRIWLGVSTCEFTGDNIHKLRDIKNINTEAVK